ncbi:ketoacid CoA transferase [Terrarubrum flagellatum]|uniref:CoA-transferase subunit beta n=1 Tax=Terrirubrum flagellatum TaxID=2895980 RepID=UPI0031452983
MTTAKEFTLAELIIAAAAEAWRGEGEVLATGIGVLPRIAASLAKLTFAPQLMMTDGEAYLVEEPVPLGPRGDYKPKFAGWMPYGRVFDNVWSGRRHAMVTPVQVDRWGQANISCLGDFRKPKVQMLGMRGFPGNSVNHRNSMFLPAHSKRAFIEGEVDVVASVGYSDKRFPEGARRAGGDLGIIVTDLCVMDFKGPDHAARVLSLHPGVTFDQAQAATGFPLLAPASKHITAAPTEEQITVIRKLDPHDLRAGVIKGNPPGARP